MDVNKKTSVSMDTLENSNWEDQHGKKKKRSSTFDIWSTRRKTIQSYITIALGFGNILRFAASMTIYGGILWIPYFVWALTVGVPLATAEIALSHYINSDMKFLWQMCPIGIGIFYNCFVGTFSAALFSLIYMSYLLHLSIEYNPSDLLDIGDDDEWAFTACHRIGVKHRSNSFENATTYREPLYFPMENYWTNASHTDKKSSEHNSHEWFYFLYLSLVCFIVLSITSFGVRSLEKFTSFLVLVPYLSAVIFSILTLTIPRSVNYIKKCWHLDWSELKNFSVWLISFEHVINGFATGNLCLTFVSVHSDFHDDIMVDVVIVFLTDFLSTFILSFTVLGLLGTLNFDGGFEISNLDDLDYIPILLCIIQGLVFLPPPKSLWKFVFFVYMITSAMGLLSFMVASVADAFMSIFKKMRTSTFFVTAGLCGLYFALGSGILLLRMERLPQLGVCFITTGLLQCITMFWIYNYQKVSNDFHFLMGYKPSLYFQFTWVISPIIFGGFLVMLIITQTEIDLIMNNAAILAATHIFIYFLCAVAEALRLWRRGENWNIFRCNPAWGPTDPLLKKSRVIFKSRVITKEHIYRQKLYKKQLVKPFNIADQNIVQLC